MPPCHRITSRYNDTILIWLLQIFLTFIPTELQNLYDHVIIVAMRARRDCDEAGIISGKRTKAF